MATNLAIVRQIISLPAVNKLWLYNGMDLAVKHRREADEQNRNQHGTVIRVG